MKIGTFRGDSLHAPENSLAALISAYVVGADLLQFELQRTSDGQLILSATDDLRPMTGENGRCSERTLTELATLDWSETFTPRNSTGFAYYTIPNRRLRPLTLREALENLPETVELLIRVGSEGTSQGTEVAKLIREYGVEARATLYAADAATLTGAADLHTALLLSTGFNAISSDIRAVVVPFATVWNGAGLTPEGHQLKETVEAGRLPGGVYITREDTSASLDASTLQSLEAEGFVYALLTRSALDTASLVRRSVTLIDTDFAGTTVDRTRFALGYAKANAYALVHQDNGIHIDIAPYTGALPSHAADPAENRLRRLETRSTEALRDWPFYSGGGVGVLQGIRGAFSARVSYQVRNVAQAVTLEMAVVNADPGAHVGDRPRSFREKDSFYDPHGAPPFAGVEHDEDDGFRINYNLGTEYDNNQYGRPVGDGRTPRGAELRLDRRGPYFAAYYRNPVDANEQAHSPQDWVCAGVARNDSLNPVVFLRCTGKRWLQENPDVPDENFPVLDNALRFYDLKIQRFIDG